MTWIRCSVGRMAAAASRLMLACLAASACQAERPGTSPAALRAVWTGARYPPPPRDVVITRGTTLGTADTAGYAIADVAAREERLLWLAADRRLILAVCGTPRHAGSPPADPGEVILDPEIVGVAREGDGAVLVDIVTSWRANRVTGRFEPVPAAGVVCLNDEGET